MRRTKAETIVMEIERDRRRGATALAERALDALYLSNEVGPALVRARPSMPLIAVVVRRARKEGVAAVRRTLKSALRKIVIQAKLHLPAKARYIVHSRSGTLDAVLRGLRAKRVTKFPADVALVGADAIHPIGDFVNAVGTAAFARRARRAGAAVFVVASELKRVRKAVPLEKGFELVPGFLVHAILTEKGISYSKYPSPGGVNTNFANKTGSILRQSN